MNRREGGGGWDLLKGVVLPLKKLAGVFISDTWRKTGHAQFSCWLMQGTKNRRDEEEILWCAFGQLVKKRHRIQDNWLLNEYSQGSQERKNRLPVGRE